MSCGLSAAGALPAAACSTSPTRSRTPSASRSPNHTAPTRHSAASGAKRTGAATERRRPETPTPSQPNAGAATPRHPKKTKTAGHAPRRARADRSPELIRKRPDREDAGPPAREARSRRQDDGPEADEEQLEHAARLPDRLAHSSATAARPPSSSVRASGRAAAAVGCPQSATPAGENPQIASIPGRCLNANSRDAVVIAQTHAGEPHKRRARSPPSRSTKRSRWSATYTEVGGTAPVPRLQRRHRRRDHDVERLGFDERDLQPGLGRRCTSGRA